MYTYMPKDYLSELDEELNAAGGLDKALEKGAQDDIGEALPETEQPAQELIVSPDAEAGLEKFRLKQVSRAEVIIKELLEKGILDPAMPLNELPAFLQAYHEKLMRGEE